MQLSRASVLSLPVALILGFGFVSEGHAQPAAVVPAWRVDTDASRLYVKVEPATTLGHSHGIVGRLIAGSVTGAGTGELVFDMASFVADKPEARQFVGLDPKSSASDMQKVTANMQSSDVLDVAKYPKSYFSIAMFVPQDGQKMGTGGRYLVKGSFILHGVKQPVQFPATLKETKSGEVLMQGTFPILQTSYDIKPYSALGGLVRIADKLQIWGELVLVPVNR